MKAPILPKLLSLTACLAMTVAAQGASAANPNADLRLDRGQKGALSQVSKSVRIAEVRQKTGFVKSNSTRAERKAQRAERLARMKGALQSVPVGPAGIVVAGAAVMLGTITAGVMDIVNPPAPQTPPSVQLGNAVGGWVAPPSAPTSAPASLPNPNATVIPVGK